MLTYFALSSFLPPRAAPAPVLPRGGRPVASLTGLRSGYSWRNDPGSLLESLPKLCTMRGSVLPRLLLPALLAADNRPGAAPLQPHGPDPRARAAAAPAVDFGKHDGERRKHQPGNDGADNAGYACVITENRED